MADAQIILSAFVAAALGLGGWALSSAVQQGKKLVGLEVKADDTEKRLDKIDKKLDRILDRLTHHGGDE